MGGVEDVLRAAVPGVLGRLAARYGQWEACEDAVQEAVVDALRQWPTEGVPADPRGWLTTVARRALVDAWRSESSRRRREETVANRDVPVTRDRADDDGSDEDDTLVLLFLCCHPALTPPSQLALTLRAVGGLTTAQVAAAFHVPEPTMSQRIRRAKQDVRAAGATFRRPDPEELPRRVNVVQQVLYLMFNEGYTASSGPVLDRPDLAVVAVRLARLLHRLLPDDGEVAGLLALMLLTHARRPARTGPDGALLPLEDQDRSRWDRTLIDQGLALLHRTLGRGPIGPYQVQAAVAALHDEAPTAEDTDWPQILALYQVLEQVAPSPMARLSRAVAVAHVHGPLAGLAVVATLDGTKRDDAVGGHRIDAVRGHLLERAGDPDAAREAYLRAARATASLPERRYLTVRAARMLPPDPP